MRHIIFISILLGNAWAFIHAQQPEVRVRYERNEDRKFQFYASSTTYAPVTLFLTFTKLEGTREFSIGMPKTYLLQYGENDLFTLRPDQENASISFAYKTSWRIGNMTEVPDTDFVYLSPIAPGKKVVANPMVSLKKYLNNKMKKGEKEDTNRPTGLTIKTQEGDTIYAIRSGIVGRIQDNSASQGNGRAFDRNENFVEIYHKDGSEAKYKLFKDHGIFVSEGDIVVAGQPIGIIGGENYEHGSHLRLILSGWFRPQKGDPERDIYNNKIYRIFIPVFCLPDNETYRPTALTRFVSVHPEAVIMQEMSKREKKKYLKGKSK